MVFGWFNTREVTEFGESLAGFVAERIPNKSPKKAPEALSKLFAQVARFKESHKLNMYKKAKLANAFRWKLIDHGYTEEFAEEMAKELLLHL